MADMRGRNNPSYRHGDSKNAMRYVGPYKAKNPEKVRAGILVRKAIRAGKLDRMDQCEVCWRKGRADAHHDDYSKPLEVRWLCRSCHNAYHRNLKAIAPLVRALVASLQRRAA